MNFLLKERRSANFFIMTKSFQAIKIFPAVPVIIIASGVVMGCH
tara:strand:- start:182 stop:313 length:132 start_codon:yes stop_codon:yes gene_type:complete